jgi:hypothetical protein
MACKQPAQDQRGSLRWNFSVDFVSDLMGRFVITDAHLIFGFRGWYMTTVKLKVTVHEKKSTGYWRCFFFLIRGAGVR